MSDYIGVGWSFPPRFNKVMRGVEMVSGQQEIEESLAVLFSTQLNERLFHGDYGCSMIDYQFAVCNSVTVMRIENMISYAVKKFEPRITLDNVGVDVDEIMNGKLTISLDYTINATNSKYNMIYPYFFEKSI